MQLRRRSHRGGAHVETGALSDILFFLMLFFLIVSTLASPNAIKLLLPKAQTGKTVPKKVIDLSVDAGRNCYIDKQAVPVGSLNTALTSRASVLEKPTVVLRMDKDLKVSDLIEVIDQVNLAKLPMVIATEKKK